MPRVVFRPALAIAKHTALGAGSALAVIAYDPAAGAADAKRALLLVAAALALSLVLAGAARGSRLFRFGVAPAGALWMAFVGWSALTLLWGAPPGVATLGLWVGASGVLAASMTLPRAEARRAASLAGTMIGGASAAFAIAEYAWGARGLAIHGGHGNPNWLGLALSVALPLSIDLALDLRREGARWWPLAAAAAALEVPALVLSHSRVAWIAAAFALAAWAVSARLLRRGNAVIAAGIAAALIAQSAAASADPTGSNDPARAGAIADDESAPGSIDTPVATAWEGRVWIWRASADAARGALPFGHGLGGFPAAYLDAQGARLSELDPKVASRRFVNATTAHCDWIEVTAFGGLPALALLLAAIVGGVVSLLRRSGDAAPNAGEDRWPAGAAALLAFSVCALGERPMHQPGVVLPVALVLGACPRSWRGPRRAASMAAAGLLLAGAALLLANSVGAWLCVRRLTRASDALPDERIPVLASAARLDPRSGEAALALGLARLELGDARAALRDLERSRALLANLGTDVAIGNARMLEGDPNRAAAAYGRALARHPGYFRARANLAEALTSLGRFDDAATHLAVARSLWPGHPKLPVIAERLRKARIDAETLETSEPPPL